MNKVVRFVKECVAELRKVSWPSRAQVLSSTKVVFVSTIILAIVLGVLDWVFTSVLRLVF